jgi:hypothetical protein
MRFHDRRDLAPLGLLGVLNIMIFARLWTILTANVPDMMVPWDFRSGFAPFLVLIGDSLKAGFLPLWNPYVAAGMPYYIFPSSQMFSPVTLIVGSIFGYSFRIAQVQLLLTVYFGAVGVYFLSKSLWNSRGAAFISAVAFQFSTAVLGNFEHMNILNCYAIAPWLFWSIRESSRPERTRFRFVISAFLCLLITMGYPGVLLMVLLWAAAYELHVIWVRPRNERLRLGASHCEAWLIGIGLAAVAWLPTALQMGDFTRGAPLNLDTALATHNLSFKHLWGTVFLFLTSQSFPGAEPDISMRGTYFGVVALALAITAVLCRRRQETAAPAALAAFGFLMATGSWFFVRTALHLALPAFNLSRFPAGDSRALAVLGCVVLAGGGAEVLLSGEAAAVSTFRNVCLVLMGLMGFGLWMWKGLVDPAQYADVVVAFISLELVILAIAFLGAKRLPVRQFLLLLGAFLVLEVATGVVANFQVAGQPVTAADWQAFSDLHEQNFSAESAKGPRIEIPGDVGLMSEMASRGYVTKKFYVSDYNHFRLYRFETVIARGFLPWLLKGPRAVALPSYSNPKSFAEFAAVSHPVSYDIVEYTPNRVSYALKLDEDSLVVFNEMFFPGWMASVDGQDARPMLETAGGLRALRLKAGAHQVKCMFRPRSLLVALAISMLAMIVLLLRVLPPGLKRRLHVLLGSRVKREPARQVLTHPDPA